MFKPHTLLFAGLLAIGHAAFAFELASTDVRADAPMSKQQAYNRFGCGGGNTSPELHWSQAPAGTRSFAVTLYDPDAPTGHGWWHWVIFDIPADAHTLRRGAGDPASGLAPAGAVQGRNDFGSAGYGGPCPPRGDHPHRYRFTVYALDTAHLDAAPGSGAAALGSLLRAHSLGMARLQATYGR